MRQIKIIIIILIIVQGLVMINKLSKNTSLINYITNINNTSSQKQMYIYKEITKSLINIKPNNIIKSINKNIKKTKTTQLVKNTISKPIIYIYNTHEEEQYYSEDNNLTVKDASKILQDALLKYEINSVVEEKSINQELYKRGLNYPDTYTISKEYLEKAKAENKTIKYFIDIHRDSAKKEITQKNYNNKNYASIMFILCTNHENYKENEKNIKIMESYIKEKYPNILRDTYIQKQYIYNVDFSPDAYLIEIGGPDNNLEEITNSLNVLAEAFNYYINKNNE